MIDTLPPSFRITAYGEVDAAALERFCEHFDTSRLLRVVDHLDRCLEDMGGMVALRDELLRLHAMSMTLVEGVPPAVWAEAEALQLDLDSLTTWICSATAVITPLTELAPDYER